MLISKDDYKKIVKFIDTKDASVAWLNRGYDSKSIEYASEEARLFNGVRSDYLCDGSLIHVDFKPYHGFNITCEEWVNSKSEAIVLKFNYMFGDCAMLMKHKKYSISLASGDSIRGFVPQKINEKITFFFTQFMSRLDTETKALIDNLRILHEEEGEKEFGLAGDKSFYKIKKTKPVLALNTKAYANDVEDTLSRLATKEDIKELKRQLLREDLKEFEQVAGVNPNHILNSDFKNDAFKTDDEIDAEEKKDDARDK